METTARADFQSARSLPSCPAKLALILFTASCLLRAAAPAPAPVRWQSPVQDKNFYLLSMLERTAGARSAVRWEPALSKLAEAKRSALANAAASCADLDCYTGALAWKPEEIDAAVAGLRALYAAQPALRRLADGPLRTCGLFQRYQAKSGADLLAEAWRDAARAIDYIIGVYGAGRPPRYPQTDAISYDVKTPAFLLLVRTTVGALAEDRAAMELFFQPSLRFALALLDANHRDEAGRFEPLEAGENAAALRRIRSIAWKKFPYSAIVVPGSGPDRATFPLSAMSKLRLTLAARRFREGKAPIVIVSGGCVYPAQTSYAEAVEMKKSLVADFGVAATAILVDPHARHTTTNLRNAARLMYRYGIPFTRQALIVTDQDQSRTIESAAFAQRSMRELGYKPYELKARLSPFDLEFVPALDSLQADAMDPLDP